MTERHPYRIDDVRRMLGIVARAIALHGDAYLPIFVMLEAELEAMESKSSALDRARRVAEMTSLA